MQTSYSINHSVAFEGQLSNAGNLNKAIPATNKSGADIAMGRFVVRDATNSSSVNLAMKLPGGASVAADLLGILAQSHAHITSSLGAVKDTQQGNVVRQGTVWMKAEEACGPGDVVFMRITADANPVGGVRKSADAGEAISLAGLASFESVALAAGDMVLVSVLLP